MYCVFSLILSQWRISSGSSHKPYTSVVHTKQWKHQDHYTTLWRAWSIFSSTHVDRMWVFNFFICLKCLSYFQLLRLKYILFAFCENCTNGIRLYFFCNGNCNIHVVLYTCFSDKQTRYKNRGVLTIHEFKIYWNLCFYSYVLQTPKHLI